MDPIAADNGVTQSTIWITRFTGQVLDEGAVCLIDALTSHIFIVHWMGDLLLDLVCQYSVLWAVPSCWLKYYKFHFFCNTRLFSKREESFLPIQDGRKCFRMMIGFVRFSTRVCKFCLFEFANPTGKPYKTIVWKHFHARTGFFRSVPAPESKKFKNNSLNFERLDTICMLIVRSLLVH